MITKQFVGGQGGGRGRTSERARRRERDGAGSSSASATTATTTTSFGRSETLLSHGPAVRKTNQQINQQSTWPLCSAIAALDHPLDNDGRRLFAFNNNCRAVRWSPLLTATPRSTTACTAAAAFDVVATTTTAAAATAAPPHHVLGVLDDRRAMELRVGNKYRLGRKIGSGSFGDIYLGEFRRVRLSLITHYRLWPLAQTPFPSSARNHPLDVWPLASSAPLIVADRRPSYPIGTVLVAAI